MQPFNTLCDCILTLFNWSKKNWYISVLVDWAELAKQWIQHKETADNSQPTPDTINNEVNLGRPPPPPPPMPTQGDDMEVVNEEENSQESNSMYTGGVTEATYSMYISDIDFCCRSNGCNTHILCCFDYSFLLV